MSALGELIIGARRRGWRTGLTATPTARRMLQLQAVEVRDREGELLAKAAVIEGDIEAAAVRAAIILDRQGLLS